MNWVEWFHYDPESLTGLRWSVQRFGGSPHNRILVVDVGDVAGCVTSSGYGEISLGGRGYKVHRVIFEMFNGALPEGAYIDHKDGNRLNNTPENLRRCDSTINAQNRAKRADNTSGATGVSKYVGVYHTYWMARWTDAEGKERPKSFRSDKCGGQAFELAKSHRGQMIKELVASGQHYTERHGA